MNKAQHDIKGCVASLKIVKSVLVQKDPELAELLAATIDRLNEISYSMSSLKKSPCAPESREDEAGLA